MLTLAETPDTLLQAMSAALASLQDPRARHWLLLPGRGRAEAILHAWAKRAGIAAHSQEVELRVLIEQAAAGSQRQRFDFDRLRLAIAGVLGTFSGHPDFPIPPSHSLSPVSAAVLDWATTIAKAVDEGMLCRAPDERWGPESFLHALTSHPTVAETLQTHLGSLRASDFESSTRDWLQSWSLRGGIPHLWIQLDEGLPALQFERLLQFVEILVATQHQDRLHLFALSPSAEYWAEARLRGNRSSTAQDDPELHPGGLLWAFGRCSQALHRQLAGTLLAEGEGGHTLPSLELPDSLLGRLQLACRRSAPLPAEELQAHTADDASITVHSARTTLRELEVCRDRIIQARHEMPDLRYEEILLLLADPKRQAPYIETALRTGDHKHPSLPFRLLGFGQSVPSPLAESVGLLLETIRGRLRLQDIQTLIENPLVAAKFGFQEALDEGQNLVGWLKDAQFRWGLNATHRSEFQNITEPRWNLFWALQRLGLGAIVSPECRDSVLVLPADSGESVALERASGLSLSRLASLAKFARALEAARSVWTQAVARPIAEWNKRVAELIETFIEGTPLSVTQHHTKLVEHILPQLEKAAHPHNPDLAPEAYVRLLGEKLASLSESSIRGGGGICVADMRQYAGVPARLILIAGLDDGSFPRRDERPSWHPLAGSYQPGDPQLRDKDRHSLLLAILACRERLVLSYLGGSDEDAKERPPSTALADLLQAIDQGSLPSTNEGPAPHKTLVFSHPLNGFSAGAFSQDRHPSARNHLPADFAAAQKLAAREGLHPFPGPWYAPLPPLAAGASRKLSIASLQTLVKEPARIFLSHLGVRLPEEQESLDGGDLLVSDGLHSWNLKSHILTSRLENSDPELLFHNLRAAGHIPRGQIGVSIWNKALSDTPDPSESFCPEERVTQTFRVPLADGADEWILEGQFKPGWYRHAGADTASFFSASSKALHHELFFCIEALVLAATSAPGELTKVEGVFRKEKTPLQLVLPPPEQARALLETLLPLYRLAHQLPLPFWSVTTKAILDTAFPKSDNTPAIPSLEEIAVALEAGLEAWTKSPQGDGAATADSPATRYAFRGCPNPFGADIPVPGILAWLPEPQQPLAWRLAHFIHNWKLNAGMK